MQRDPEWQRAVKQAEHALTTWLYTAIIQHLQLSQPELDEFPAIVLGIALLSESIQHGT